MANKKEINKFIKEKLKEKTVTLNIAEAQEQIKNAAENAMKKNEGLLAENKNAIDIVKKIAMDVMNAIVNDLFKEQIKEIVNSEEFIKKFACESSADEVIESDIVDDELKEFLKILKKNWRTC